MIPPSDTKMLKRKKRGGSKSRERSQFAYIKSVLLAAAQRRLQNGVTTAATSGVDGHEVSLSEEFVRQKPSLARSEQWDVAATAQPVAAAPSGGIRVCWQCPESRR